jgi:hypothetical protein
MKINHRTNTNVDRRRNFRKAPDKFAFIQLERDDGGAVLNVSEGGLSFNTFAPLQLNGPIHFWFSLNLNERIEAWGEVAWMNDAKKVGGLRFIRLSERARRQVREWLSKPFPEKVPDEKVALQALAGQPSSGAANEPDAVARFVSKARSKRAPILSSSEESGSSNTLSPQVEATGELVPLQRYLSARRRQFSRGLLIGMCISAAVLVPMDRYLKYRHEKKNSGPVYSDATPPKRDAESVLSATASAPARPSADIFSGGKPKNGTLPDRTPKIQMPSTASQPQSRASERGIPSQPSPTTAEPHLSGAANQRKASMTPQQLWAAVQTGNSKAAVTLAELYIKGEGVSQNCDQARVLLLVASEKRNADAIKRLHDLDKTGCPLPAN